MSFNPLMYVLCKGGDSCGSSGGSLPVIEITEYDPKTPRLSDESTAQLKTALATSDFAIVKINPEIGMITPLLVQKFNDEVFCTIVTGIGTDVLDKVVPVYAQVIIGLQDGLGFFGIYNQ